MRTVDVAVVGAGPAGAAAAAVAARAGLRVVAVDRARFPRDKCCGDGLTTGALRRLEALGLDPAALPSWQPIGGVNVRVVDGRHTRLRFPADGTVHAATARRVELDAALVELARQAGAEVLDGVGVVAARPAPGGGGVELDLEDGDALRAPYAVAADGMWSPLRKALGAGEPGYLGEWHAVRQYASRVGPRARDLWVWLEDSLRPGYAWSFPLPGGRANVGFGIRRTPGQPTGGMKRQWEELLGLPHVAEVLGPDVVLEEPLKAWPIPTDIGGARLAALGGRVLFAGDAARAADCLTGEGIAQALETGELAAASLARTGPHSPHRAAASYHGALRRGMLVDDRVSALCSRVLAGERGSRRWFDLATSTARRRDHFARWMFEDYPRALPFTPWRWRPGILRRPGPYDGTWTSPGAHGRGDVSSATPAGATTGRGGPAGSGP
jgi:geranylgeranyl reductase family protein